MDITARIKWTTDIEQLLASVQTGSKGAFHLLYSKTNDKLYGLVLKIVADEHIAADAVQEAYVKVWMQIDKFNGNAGDAWGWLCQIFRHQAIDHYRRQQRLAAITRQQSIQEPYREIPLDWENNSYLNQLLRPLSVEQQQALVSAYVYGFSHQELASKLGQPVGTIKSRIRRSLQQIKTSHAYHH